MPDKPKFPLNEAQTRRMAIVLSRLERALLDLRADIALPPKSSPLTICEDPIDPARTDALNIAIAETGEKIQQLARDLNLPAAIKPVRRTHLVALGLLDIDLYESRPSKGLGNYGEVPAPAAEYLEKEIPELEARVNQITSLLSENKNT
jgi:hypothetical protein